MADSASADDVKPDWSAHPGWKLASRLLIGTSVFLIADSELRSRSSAQGSHLTSTRFSTVCDNVLRRAADDLLLGTFVSEASAGIHWLTRAGKYALTPPQQSSNTDILIFGDSIDRYMVTEACRNWGAPGLYEWGKDTFRYAWGQASQSCPTAWGSLAFVHMYGARPHPPYFQDAKNGHDGNYASPDRVRKAVELYQEKFIGLPTVVVYQSSLWDLQLYGGTGQEQLSAERILNITDQFVADVHGMLDLIQQLLPSAVLLLRTTPVMKKPHQLAAELNAALRFVAKARGLPILDWDAMMRDEYHKDWLRDDIHPNSAYMWAFNEILVGYARWAQALTGRQRAEARA